MKLTLILLACVASVMCDHTLECGPLQRLRVRNVWVAAYGHDAAHREKFGREVWDYVFDHDPKSHELFERVRGDNLYSHEFDAHMVRVFGGLDICIALLSDEDVLNAELTHLHEQHLTRGVTEDHFNLFEEALDHAIPLHSKHFDQDAWDACYRIIADAIKH